MPRFTFARVFTEWGLDPFLFIGTVWVTGLYLIGVVVLHRRGDRWPIGRTLAFVGAGMGGFVFATSSGISAYDTTLLSVHMVQHMILSMWVPLFLALGAPVTLALRTLPGSTKAGPRRWLLAVLHSRVVKVLSFPLLAFALYVLSPWALYFTGWYDASLDSVFVHEMMHIHLVLVGSLFFWPLMGIDPIPGRVGYPFRLLLVFLTLPFHAFLGVTIMSQDNLIGEKHYLLLREGPMGDWLPSIAAEQNLAGGILWASGELVGVVFFATLFVQWVRSSIKEAKQVDRRLDRQESRAAATRRPADG
nr:cytochrome c oxidase assembly protein [Nocardioides daedukensis]